MSPAGARSTAREMPAPPTAESIAAGHRSRIDRLRECLATDRLAGAILSRPVWRRYFCGACGEAGILLITSDAAWLVAPNDAVDPQAVSALGVEPLLVPAYDPAALVDAATSVASAAADLVRRAAPRGQLGAELSHLPVGIVRGSEGRLVELGPTLRRLRSSKDQLEIAGLRRAVAAVERGLAAAGATAVPGATEYDLLDAVLARLRSYMGDDFQLSSNVASGPRTALPDPHATDRVLESGDLVLLDLYPLVGGYAADLTRTFGVGEVPAVWQERESAVKAALAAGAAALAEGAMGRAVSQAIRDRLAAEAGELAGSMTHHAGHGIGIKAWETPWIGSRSNDPVQAGHVVCLEPGLYEPGVGGLRVEGEFLVTSMGVERLDVLELDLEGIGA